MAVYRVTDSELTSVANAIRAAGSSQEQLAFPTGFVNAIEANSDVLKDLVNGTLSSFTAPSGTWRIKNNLFSSSELEELILPSSVTTIDTSAFQNCGVLAHVVFAEGLQIIGQAAFAGCQTLLIGELYEEDGAWYGCLLPDSLRYIGESAFSDAWVTSRLVLGPSIVQIGKNAFHDAQSEDYSFDVVFTNTPTSIHASAFSSDAIENIYVPWAQGAVANAPWGATNATIHYNWSEE